LLHIHQETSLIFLNRTLFFFNLSASPLKSKSPNNARTVKHVSAPISTRKRNAGSVGNKLPAAKRPATSESPNVAQSSSSELDAAGVQITGTTGTVLLIARDSQITILTEAVLLIARDSQITIFLQKDFHESSQLTTYIVVPSLDLSIVLLHWITFFFVEI